MLYGFAKSCDGNYNHAVHNRFIQLLHFVSNISSWPCHWILYYVWTRTELKRAARQFLEGVEETAKQSDLKVCRVFVELSVHAKIYLLNAHHFLVI